MLRTTLALALALTCALGAGCGAGPDLTFADDDDAGGVDASIPDASVEASTIDAGDTDVAPPADTGVRDTGPVDTGVPPVCPVTPPPPGVSMCCGVNACIDRTGNNSCAQCAACTQLGCKPTEVCCYAMNNGNLGCKKSAADCK